jgi:hypothetical protein
MYSDKSHVTAKSACRTDDYAERAPSLDMIVGAVGPGPPGAPGFGAFCYALPDKFLDYYLSARPPMPIAALARTGLRRGSHQNSTASKLVAAELCRMR